MFHFINIAKLLNIVIKLSEKKRCCRVSAGPELTSFTSVSSNYTLIRNHLIGFVLRGKCHEVVMAGRCHY